MIRIEQSRCCFERVEFLSWCYRGCLSSTIHNFKVKCFGREGSFLWFSGRAGSISNIFASVGNGWLSGKYQLEPVLIPNLFVADRLQCGIKICGCAKQHICWKTGVPEVLHCLLVEYFISLTVRCLRSKRRWPC